MDYVPLDGRRPRYLAISFAVALGLALPMACGGGSSGGAGHNNSATGGVGGADGGSTGGTAGTGGAPDAGTDTSTPPDSGQPDVVTPPDSGTDGCKMRNGGVEICDGFDDDCNGKVDDHVAVPNTSPQAYVGDPCQPCGTWQCPVLGTGAPKCIANGDAGTQVETCDGKDDNCDGIIDNVVGIGNSCGQCGNGHLECPGDGGVGAPSDAGLGLVCVGDTTPTTEICDGKDDNCDGTPDNITTFPTCQSLNAAPATPSGYVCDGSSTVPVLASAVKASCPSGATSWNCNFSPAVYYFLDADNDGYPEPVPGITPDTGKSAVEGPEVYNYNPGPYCNNTPPNATPAPPGTPHWIKTNYDWRVPAQRAADPYFAQHSLNRTNSGFDCCDAEPDAYPGEQKYYQLPTSAPNGHNPIPSVCTNTPNNGLLATQPWDFNCDGVYEHQAPANTGTNWQQCAADCSRVGWDTFYPVSGHCWHDCGDTTGNWLYTTQCSAPGHRWSPECH